MESCTSGKIRPIPTVTPSLSHVTKTLGGDVMMMKSMALVVVALVGQAFADYQFDDSWTRIG